MSHTLILKFALKLITPVLILLSVLIYWRGHQLPGGGFIAGLVAGGALAMRDLFTDKIIQSRTPFLFIQIGLATALLSGLIAVILGHESFMKSVWVEVPLIGSLGTPMLFDLGVYFIVIGFVTMAVSSLKRIGQP